MRRKFIKEILTNSIGILSLGFFEFACKSNDAKLYERNENGVSSCDDLSRVPMEEIKKREGLAYVKQSQKPNEYCSNCRFYIFPKEKELCGGCALFSGPVFKDGYCVYWAPRS